MELVVGLDFQLLYRRGKNPDSDWVGSKGDMDILKTK